MVFYLLFCLPYQELYVSTCSVCSEVVCEFEQRATYFLSINENQTHCSSSWDAKMSLTLNEPVQNALCSNLHTTFKHAPNSS